MTNSTPFCALKPEERCIIKSKISRKLGYLVQIVTQFFDFIEIPILGVHMPLASVEPYREDFLQRIQNPVIYGPS